MNGKRAYLNKTYVMITPMNRFEHSAQTEQNTSDEQPVETATNATERQESRYDNPRIKTLVDVRDKAERALQEAVLDFETRDTNQAFQTAKELFDGGTRLHEVYNSYENETEYHLCLPDGLETIYRYDGQRNSKSPDMTPVQMDHDMFVALSMPPNFEVIAYLIDLTAEE